MRITLWSKDTFIIQWKDQPPPNDYVQSPVVITEQVEVIRGGAKKIVKEFDYNDFGSPLLLGLIPRGASIINTVLEVIDSFNLGAITIGTQDAQGILMTTGEVVLTQGKYQRNNYLEIESPQTFKAFFSGSPSQGSGKITTFYIE